MKAYFALLFLMLLLTPTGVQSQEKIRIATHIEPPFYHVVDNKFVGDFIEIAHLLTNAANLTPVFLECPFARCLSMVKLGQADMIFGVRKTEEREQYLTFLSPPIHLQYQPLRFYTLADSAITINHFEDLKPLTIGVLRGGTYFDRFDHDKTLRKVEVTAREQLISMLLKKHIDTFLEREESINPLIVNAENYKKLKLAEFQYDKAVASYIAISKTSNIKNLAEELTKQLRILTENGAIEQINARRKITNHH